jgi:hypothetical protein
VKYELGMMWKEENVIYLKKLPWYFYEGIEENLETFNSEYPVFFPRSI